MTSLLPPNSTDLERKLAEAGKDAFDLPSIRIIKDIDQVPAQFLPFIAWQKSVDYWDENWQEALKRKVIKESRALHRLKFLSCLSGSEQATHSIFQALRFLSCLSGSEPISNSP